jgi:nucleoside-diphosphate-sugar epimerase
VSTGSAGLRNERILVTGGSGFIGTNLIEAFRQEHVVANFDIAPPRNPKHADHWYEGDLLDIDAVRRAFTEFAPTIVQHMAARTDLLGRTLADYATNTRGVENLIEAVAENGSVRRVVFASSRMVCQIGYAPVHEEDYCPPTVYGESKVISERIVRAADLPVDWIIVRPTSIWGPWFDVPYRDFFVAIARAHYFHVGERRVLKSFGFIGNTVHQLDRIAAAPRDAIHGRTIYLADYPPLEVHDWADRISKALGSQKIRTLPYGVLKVVAVAGDLAAALGWNGVPLTTFRLANLLTEMVHDLEPLEEIVGELPFSLDEGVATTVAWLKATQGV